MELSRGNPSAARDYAARCLKHAEPTKSRKYIAGAWTLLGDCAVAALDWEAAEKWYAKANAMVRAIGHALQIWQTHAALGQLYRDTDRLDQSRLQYSSAARQIERLRQATKDERLLAGLKGAARMNDVRERAADSRIDVMV